MISIKYGEFLKFNFYCSSLDNDWVWFLYIVRLIVSIGKYFDNYRENDIKFYF